MKFTQQRERASEPTRNVEEKSHRSEREREMEPSERLLKGLNELGGAPNSILTGKRAQLHFE